MKSTIEEVKNQDIDWSQKQLVIIADRSMVILTDGGYSTKYFSGTIVHHSENSGKIGTYSTGWDKRFYRPYAGKVIIE